MKAIQESSRFRRDMRRMRRRGKDLSKLTEVVRILAGGEELDERHVPHPLAGNWRSYWDCHIEPDWLLLYKVTEDVIALHRTGSHSDLFG